MYFATVKIHCNLSFKKIFLQTGEQAYFVVFGSEFFLNYNGKRSLKKDISDFSKELCEGQPYMYATNWLQAKAQIV